MKTPIIQHSLNWILWLLVVLATDESYAQIYTFSQSQAPYQELTSYKSLDASLVYNNSFEQAEIGFDFQVFGQRYSSVNVFAGFVSFSPSSGSLSAVFPFSILNAELYDLNPQFPATTQINYTTRGEAGSQVFILEYKRAGIGIRDSIDGDSLIPLGFTSFQVRIYETNGNIEIHYGTSFIRDNFETLQQIGLYKNLYSEGIGLQGPVTNLRATGWRAANPPDPVENIPSNGTIYLFSYDRDLVWNNLPGAYHENLGWNLINGLTTNSGLLNTGTIAPQLGGALLGHSKYKDLEFAEKYVLSENAIIKGLVTQNYGAVHSTDSASFSIYTVAANGLPGSLLAQKKKPYRCLNLEGKLNYIAFDQAVAVADSFFVAFGLNAYSKVDQDTLGLYFTTADSTVGQNSRFGRVAARWFNNEWYDVFSTKMVSNRTEVILISDQYGGLNDMINLAVFPVVNFNTESTTSIEENLDCKPLTQRSASQIEESFISSSHLKLHPNFPNPASSATYLNFSLTKASPIMIQVFTQEGRLIFEVNKASVAAGYYRYQLNTEAFANGIYLYVIRSANAVLSSKIVVNR